MPRHCHASISAKGIFYNQIKELLGAARRSGFKFFDTGLTRNNWNLTPIPPASQR
jgi:hypothetical protein